MFDVLVVGVPDERWGERVCALLQPRPGCTPTLETLQEHCRDLIAGYKVPRQLLLVDEVPRLPNGKPDYRSAKSEANSPRDRTGVGAGRGEWSTVETGWGGVRVHSLVSSGSRENPMARGWRPVTDGIL